MAGPTTDAGAADAVAPRPPIPDEILGPRLIAIGRRLPSRAILAIGEGLLAGGVRAFEVTLDSDSGLASLELLAGRLGPAGLLVGAGTVLDVESAARARDAGAQFIVSPHTDAGVVAFAAGNGIPAFPGAFTPTEMLAAWRAGASAVKVFPASAVGPTFVRELRGPFRDIPLIPTGGVTPDNASAFLEAGAVAVGIGSWLTGDGEPDGIASRGAELVRRLARSNR